MRLAPPVRADRSVVRVLQRSIGNRAIGRLVGQHVRQSDARVIQRKWVFVSDTSRFDATNDTYYWDSSAQMPTVAPGAARRYKLARADSADFPNNLGGRLEQTEANYLLFRGGGASTRGGKGDRYNPFGRFSTNLTKAAYVPRNTPWDKYVDLGTTLFAGLGDLVAEHASITAVDELAAPIESMGYWFPPRVQVGGTTWLDLLSLDPLGATYGDAPAFTAQSRAGTTGEIADVPTLKHVASELAKYGATGAVKAVIDEGVIKAYAGSRKNEDQQYTIMGASAGDMAKAAGLDAAIDPDFAADQTPTGKKKHGWQWLHLISYALGGPTDIGPQNAANLVVGTTAANTAMIMIEDAINNAITDKSIPVKSAILVAKPIMADATYLIAQTITYQVTFTLDDGRALPELTLSFDAMTTSTPFEATNKYFRTTLKAMLAEEKAKPVREYESMFL